MAFVDGVFKVIWIYSYLSIALVAAIALVPSLLLLEWAWNLPRVAGMILTGPSAPPSGHLLHAYLVCVAVFLAWFLFGIALIIVLAAVRPLLGRSREGELRLPSMAMWQFYNYDGLLLFFSIIYAQFLRSTWLYPVYLRLMGAKVGRNVIINTAKIYDHDLLEIGDNVLIGGDVIIIAHIAQRNKLIRKRVKIGSNVTIGQCASIFPGAQIGDNVVVGAHTLVLKDQVLPTGTVWGGVPAKQIGDRRPF